MDTSELIKQVKLRPVIWSEARRDNKKMAAAWQQICKMAWPDFMSRSVDEKRTKCLQLQKQWKMLKLGYTNERLRQKQGKSRGSQKSLYYDQLKFLDTAIDTTPTNNTASASSSPSTSTAPTPDRDDEDRQFLLSLVSFMQDVPRSSKLALRSEMMQVIAKYSGGDSTTDHHRELAFSQEY